jgi:hypothetical protein
MPSSVASLRIARSRTLWDRLGAVLSGLCLVHCLAIPVALAFLPLLPFADAFHAWMHPVMAAVILPVTLIAGWVGYRAHGKRSVPVVLALGLLLVFGGASAAHAGVAVMSLGAEMLETSATVSGSLVLVAGHAANALSGRRSKACTCPAHSGHDD